MGSVEVGKKFETEEMMGMYGEMVVHERTLQRVWMRGDFIKEGLRSVGGKEIKVVDAGKWNKLEGPDFKDARIEINGEELYGDVEVHFHAKDWFSHGHELDEKYRNVVLHVVLFEPEEGRPLPYTEYGYCPEVVVLLDRLLCSLEEYAGEEALLAMSNRDILVAMEGFLELGEQEQAERIRLGSMKRWHQKRGFSKKRLETLGYEGALHITILEVLGYRRNRGVMSDIAARYEKKKWEGISVEDIYKEFEGRWTLKGLRPSNYPRRRLTQYHELIRKVLSYPENLRRVIVEYDLAEKIGMETRDYRKTRCLSELRGRLEQEVFGGEIRSTRLDTLIVDGLLPLMSVELGVDMYGAWRHWYGGDISKQIEELLKASKIGGVRSNGINQGMLELVIEAGLM